MATDKYEQVATAASLYPSDDGDDEEDDEFYIWNHNSGDDEGDDSEGDFAGSDTEDEEEQAKDDYAVLTGSIHLNDDGRVVYSGTWCMNSELDKDDDGGSGCNEDDAGQKEKNNHSQRHQHHRKHKKHPKFKLRSQEVYLPWPLPASGNEPSGSNGNVTPKKAHMALFDVNRPTLSQVPSSTSNGNNEPTNLPGRRTIIFDGFFFEALSEEENKSASSTSPVKTSGSGSSNGEKHHHHHHHHHGKKVRERDVEIFFTLVKSEIDDNGDGKEKTAPTYIISGRGHNDYGPFVLNGTFMPSVSTDSAESTKDDRNSSNDNNHGPSATIICKKKYGSGGAAKETKPGAKTAGDLDGHIITNRATKRNRGAVYKDGNDHDDDDDEDWCEEKADFEELIELTEDAGLSIEELRKKYYGGGGDNDDGVAEKKEDYDGGGKLPPAKKAKIDDSDDDECGF
mmetsp:Transcript_2323/g.4934  ORF Transcript_2323/g.4934 Transcript_2323/m.4934 type:complete len:453 (+) Transcript_2323:191-1549(+)